MLFIPAVFLGIIAIALLCLAVMGIALMIVLRVLTAILWIAIKIVEHRMAEPEILIVIEDDERPRPMRDVTPTVRKIEAH